MTAFICDKKDIDSGQFPIDDLKTFTENTKTVIVIPGYAYIKDGEVKYLQ